MTELARNHAEQQPPSLFGEISTAELLRIRIKPAQFARLLGVSKQTVSRWQRRGIVTLSPLDGTLDPQQAMRQVLMHADSSQLRAGVLRSAVSELADLRHKAAALAPVQAERDAAAAAASEAQREAASLRARLADSEAYAELAAERLHALAAAARAALARLGPEALPELASALQADEVDDEDR